MRIQTGLLDLKKHLTIEILRMVEFYAIFKVLHLSIFFEIFELLRKLMLKLFILFYFIWTL